MDEFALTGKGKVIVSVSKSELSFHDIFDTLHICRTPIVCRSLPYKVFMVPTLIHMSKEKATVALLQPLTQTSQLCNFIESSGKVLMAKYRMYYNLALFDTLIQSRVEDGACFCHYPNGWPCLFTRRAAGFELRAGDTALLCAPLFPSWFSLFARGPLSGAQVQAPARARPLAIFMMPHFSAPGAGPELADAISPHLGITSFPSNWHPRPGH